MAMDVRAIAAAKLAQYRAEEERAKRSALASQCQLQETDLRDAISWALGIGSEEYHLEWREGLDKPTATIGGVTFGYYSGGLEVYANCPNCGQLVAGEGTIRSWEDLGRELEDWQPCLPHRRHCPRRRQQEREQEREEAQAIVRRNLACPLRMAVMPQANTDDWDCIGKRCALWSQDCLCALGHWGGNEY